MALDCSRRGDTKETALRAIANSTEPRRRRMNEREE